jgi:hypothetical protein
MRMCQDEMKIRMFTDISSIVTDPKKFKTHPRVQIMLGRI